MVIQKQADKNKAYYPEVYIYVYTNDQKPQQW